MICLHLPLRTKLKRGDAFLPDVSVSKIESLQTKNTGCKIKYILQAVRLREEGRTFRDIAKAVGIPKSTVYGWLQRVAVGGFDRIHDSESPGRPCRLSDEQKESPENDLLKHQTECKFLRGFMDCKDGRTSHCKRIQNPVQYQRSASVDTEIEFFDQIPKICAIQLCHA